MSCDEWGAPRFLVENFLAFITFDYRDCISTFVLPIQVPDYHFQSLCVCLVRMPVHVFPSICSIVKFGDITTSVFLKQEFPSRVILRIIAEIQN